MAAEFRIKKANKFKLEALEALEDIDPIVEDVFESIDDEDEDGIVTEDDEDTIVEDEDLDDLETNPEDEDEEVDPLVKALRQSDDNEDYYNDNENE